MEHELEQVISWLEAGDEADYRAGVLLLQERCGNRSLVNNLLRKESVANREKLRYELVKLGCQGRMEDVSEVLTHFAQAVQGAVPAVADVVLASQAPALEQIAEAVQPAVDELTQQLSKLHNQRCQLSNSLADLDPAEGPRVVAEILSLQNQYNALAEQRRRLAAGEVLAVEQPAPEQPAPAGEPLDRAELVKQRSNLRSNISKARKSAETAKTEDKRSHYAQKAGQLEVELNLIDMQLALPQANG